MADTDVEERLQKRGDPSQVNFDLDCYAAITEITKLRTELTSSRQREQDAANALEQRLWAVIDRDGLGDVPSDIVGAVSALVRQAKSNRQREAELQAQVAGMRLGIRSVFNRTPGLEFPTKGEKEWMEQALAATPPNPIERVLEAAKELFETNKSEMASRGLPIEWQEDCAMGRMERALASLPGASRE